MSSNDLFGTQRQIVWWHEGENTISLIKEICSRHRVVLLVYDARAFAVCGAEAFLELALKECEVYAYPVEFTLPSFSLLQKALQDCPLHHIDMIVAVGGGTTIDFAKLIRYYGGRAAQGDIESIDELMGVPLEIPFLAIPTTSGSGSEATPFAVLYVDGIKHSVNHHSILPEYVYLYPELTRTLPAMQRAATGLDALCQGIESFWSVGATVESQEIARIAILEARKHLVQHVKNPGETSRIGMVMASHMAGRAIAATKTTVCHALSYTMTSEYGMPHGIAVAMTLGPALLFNAHVTDQDVADPRGAAYVRDTMHRLALVLGYESPEAACEGMNALLDAILGGHKPADFGIETEEDVLHIARSVNMERLKNNPRMMTEEALVGLLS